MYVGRPIKAPTKRLSAHKIGGGKLYGGMHNYIHIVHILHIIGLYNLVRKRVAPRTDSAASFGFRRN